MSRKAARPALKLATRPAAASARLGGMNKLAITWIFEFEGERSYVQRQDGLDHITVLTWSHLDQNAIVVETDREACSSSSPPTGIGVSRMGACRMLPGTPTGW